ncbi:PP79 [Orf virus]|uniref:PP79 n=1 Tax=Orf virus TaxID=10258 RepID=F1AX56_ORFV|nr:PP79 [Orf virus]
MKAKSAPLLSASRISLAKRATLSRLRHTRSAARALPRGRSASARSASVTQRAIAAMCSRRSAARSSRVCAERYRDATSPPANSKSRKASPEHSSSAGKRRSGAAPRSCAIHTATSSGRSPSTTRAATRSASSIYLLRVIYIFHDDVHEVVERVGGGDSVQERAVPDELEHRGGHVGAARDRGRVPHCLGGLPHGGADERLHGGPRL